MIVSHICAFRLRSTSVARSGRLSTQWAQLVDRHKIGSFSHIVHVGVNILPALNSLRIQFNFLKRCCYFGIIFPIEGNSGPPRSDERWD